MAAVKVLLAGPCDGHLGALYKRIQTVNAKSGPFQVLFCVGRFFSEGELHDHHHNKAAFTSRDLLAASLEGCWPQLITKSLHVLAGSADADPDAEAVEYVTRTEAVSVPTYCIGGYGEFQRL